MRRSQGGFTLIELVLVIVILGVLSVTVAPQFMGISSDAKKATMDTFEGTLKTANQMVYAKSMIKSQGAYEKGEIETPGGEVISTRFGYIGVEDKNSRSQSVSENPFPALDAEMCDINDFDCEGDWAFHVSGDSVKFFHKSVADEIQSTGDTSIQCFVEYTMPESYGDRPEYKSEKSGC